MMPYDPADDHTTLDQPGTPKHQNHQHEPALTWDGRHEPGLWRFLASQFELIAQQHSDRAARALNQRNRIEAMVQRDYARAAKRRADDLRSRADLSYRSTP